MPVRRVLEQCDERRNDALDYRFLVVWARHRIKQYGLRRIRLEEQEAAIIKARAANAELIKL